MVGMGSYSLQEVVSSNPSAVSWMDRFHTFIARLVGLAFQRRK